MLANDINPTGAYAAMLFAKDSDAIVESLRKMKCEKEGSRDCLGISRSRDVGSQ